MKHLSAYVLRRRTPSFAIVSLPRSGSTALFRALSLGSRVRIAYEPDLKDAWMSHASLSQACRRLLSYFNGIKHVWDPNGWPFGNTMHRSSLNTLARSQQWIEVNSALLDCVDKVVFLRRRNQLARVVSDLLGQQTDLWGHNPDAPHSEDEAAEYRENLRRQSLGHLDEHVIEWYLLNAASWEDQILSRVPDHRRTTLFYRDLFDPEVGIDARLARLAEIGDWLGIPVRTKDSRVRAIMGAGSKLNDRSTYERIPNFGKIVARFGEV